MATGVVIARSSHSPRATLDHGKIFGNSWATRAYRDKSGRTCLSVSTEQGDFGLNGLQCNQSMKGREFQITIGMGSGRRKAIAALYVRPLSVKRIRTTRNGGCPARWVHLKRLGIDQARRAHVRRNFRYKSVAQKVCR